MPQSIPKGLTREHVLQALADLDAGIEHPFGTATGYELVHDGRRYAPKAVVGVAFRHVTGEILHHSQFSGGEAPGQANYVLRRLGFRVTAKEKPEPDEGLRGTAWVDEEIQLLVAEYLEMLHLEVAGKEFNKAARNRALRELLPGRTKGSVEFKHQNVSAVMVELGLPRVRGYKPAGPYQAALLEAVKDCLAERAGLLQELAAVKRGSDLTMPRAGSTERLFEAPPDFLLTARPPLEPWLTRRGVKVDFAQREAASRRLGRLGEEFTVDLEKRRLLAAGRDDLAGRVAWVSQEWGDGVGFDVLSFDADDDSERWLEVKTTTLGKCWPFYVTANEVSCSEAESERYELYRLFSFQDTPRLFVLHGSLSENCTLEPTQYRAGI